MDPLTQISIIGVVVSVIMQLIKKYAGTNGTKAEILTIVIAFVGAGIYVAIKDTNLFPTFMTVLAVASVAYNFLISKIGVLKAK